MSLPGGFFFSLTKGAGVPPLFSPLSFRVCPRCCLRRALPQAFPVQSLPRADGRRGCPMAARRERGPGVNSAPSRPGCRTRGCRRAAAACRKVGHTVTLAVRTPCPLLRALSLAGLGALLNVPGCITPGSRLAFTTVSEPEAEICWLFFFFSLLACQGQRALSCFMSFLRRRPSQQSVAAWSSVLLCAS